MSLAEQTEVPSTYHQRSITNTIIEGVDESVFKVDGIENQPDLKEEGELLNYVTKMDSLFISWLNTIVTSADDTVNLCDDGEFPNAHYSLDFAIDFIRLCKILPLWSGISCDIFGIDDVTSSSSNVESDFKNVKQIHAQEIPCSVDVFVEAHINSLRGGTIEASHEHNYLKFVGDENDKEDVPEIDNSTENENQSKLSDACNDDESEKRSQIVSQTLSEMEYEEGWRPDRQPKKQSAIKKLPSKKVTSKYLNPAPNWTLSNNIKQKVKIGILQNGNINNTLHKTSKNNVTGLRNTCTFDCVCQVKTRKI